MLQFTKCWLDPRPNTATWQVRCQLGTFQAEQKGKERPPRWRGKKAEVWAGRP